MRPNCSCSLFKNLRKQVFWRQSAHLLLPWGLGSPVAPGGGCGCSRKGWNKPPNFCNHNLHCKLGDSQSGAIGLRKGKNHLFISINSINASLQPYKLINVFQIFSFCPQLMTPTCQDVSHDGVPEKGDVVDDVPEAFEVGQKVVDGVGWRLQGNFHPGEKLSWKYPDKRLTHWTKRSEALFNQDVLILCE